MSGHCQPTDALVADCCAGREQPGESARVSLAAPGSKAPGLSAVADAASADQPSPVPSAARPPALDGKLHSIGRHTLFQSFLA